MAGKAGGEVSRAAGMDPRGSGRDSRGGWLPRWPGELAAAFADRKAAEWRASWARVSGLVVRERGWACSEWVAAGAAGEAKAAEGVAGESSVLQWEEAGLSQDFSGGRYWTHGFLLLEARAPKRRSTGSEKLRAVGTAGTGASAGCAHVPLGPWGAHPWVNQEWIENVREKTASVPNLYRLSPFASIPKTI